MSEIATIEPLSFVAGDTVKWKRTLDDYPASDDWVLKYSARTTSAVAIAITAAADGDDHLVTLAAADTAEYTASTYKWTAWVEKDDERYTVGEGYFTVKPNLATGTTAITDERIQLEADIAAIDGYLAKNYKYQNYAINGRSLSQYPMADLYLLKDRLARQLNRLKDAERVQRGMGSRKIVRVRMSQ